MPQSINLQKTWKFIIWMNDSYITPYMLVAYYFQQHLNIVCNRKLQPNCHMTLHYMSRPVKSHALSHAHIRAYPHIYIVIHNAWWIMLPCLKSHALQVFDLGISACPFDKTTQTSSMHGPHSLKVMEQICSVKYYPLSLSVLAGS